MFISSSLGSSSFCSGRGDESVVGSSQTGSGGSIMVGCCCELHTQQCKKVSKYAFKVMQHLNFDNDIFKQYYLSLGIISSRIVGYIWR